MGHNAEIFPRHLRQIPLRRFFRRPAAFKGEVNLDIISPDTNLLEAIGLNSIVGIEILVRIEKEFAIQIDDEDLTVELIKTLATIAEYIECKWSENAGNVRQS